MEIKCQLDATDDFYCRSYCLLNMFRATLCVRFAGCCSNPQTGHIVLPETCWASNKICNKNHLLHLVGNLFPHINDDARSKPHQIKFNLNYFMVSVCISAASNEYKNEYSWNQCHHLIILCITYLLLVTCVNKMYRFCK